MILGLKFSTFIIWILCSALIGYVVGYITGKNNRKK